MNEKSAGLVKNNALPRGLAYMDDDDVRDAADVINGSKLDKLQFIYDLKCAFKWTQAKTHKDLAKVWNMTEASLRAMSVEADNHFKMNLGDSAAIQKSLFDRMETITVGCMNNKKALVVQTSRDTQDVEYVEAPDHKTALAGLIAMGNMAGVSSKKTDVTIKVEQVTHIEMLEKMRKDIAEDAAKNLILAEGTSEDD